MKKIFNMLLFLAAMTFATSCTSEVDDAFPQSSAQRMAETVSSTKATLQSSPTGWLMRMYGDLDFGGYTVLCKFEGDYVSVMSEIYGPADTVTSHYKVEQSAGTILSFDEYNRIFHFFSDPANPAGLGLNGKGFFGDLEFRVLKATSDSIIMTGKKHGNRIVMTPAPEDWAGYINKVYDMEDFITSASYALKAGDMTLPTKSSFRLFEATNPTTGEVTELPYIVTDKGVEFYKTYTINGKAIKGFTCTGEVWPELSDATTTLAPVITPLNQLLAAKAWYISYSNIGPYGKPYWQQYANGTKAVGETLASATFGLSDLDGNKFGYQFNSGGYRGAIYWTYELVGDDQIAITYTGKSDSTPGNGAWYWNNARLNYGMYPFGIDGKARTFKLETDRLSNPSYILMTDTSNPDNWFKLSAKAITNPFAK